MAFSSELYPGERVFDDGAAGKVTLFPKTKGRGLDLSSRPDGFAYSGVAEPFPRELLIPRSEWQARIQEKEERKTRISDLCIAGNLNCKNQRSTNYCWIFGPTTCLEIIRLIQNQETVLLSPASCGSKITGFKNVGGWGKPGLEYIVKHGVVPMSMWPETAIDRKYDTPAAWEEAKKYKVLEWWELEPRNLDEQISCLLHNIPIAVGLNFWSHEVTLCDAAWIDGAIAERFRNSWGMDWPKSGAMGFSIFQGSKMLSDDSVAPRVAIAA